jgi:hypothetical protein
MSNWLIDPAIEFALAYARTDGEGEPGSPDEGYLLPIRKHKSCDRAALL